MLITLQNLEDSWLDAVWSMLVLAYERDHCDASDFPITHIEQVEQQGVDAWINDLYPTDIGGKRLQYMDGPVDLLLDLAEFRARLLICARDHGLQAAMLMKLAYQGGDA